ncbi:hypothetical protein C8F01DRAFT_1242463 [Mycena amicta]|nr:hypothetical protein C8F01DRAFT_1242463 [Mycena amicta]
MRFSLVAAAALPVFVSAADILVQVGAGGQLAFSPTNVTAAVWRYDLVPVPGQEPLGYPIDLCEPGIDSGFQLVPANATQLPQWSFTVNNASAPLWFFCAQTIPGNHCQAGMVFSVNANPDSPKSFAAYQALAKGGDAAAAASSVAGDVASAVASGADAATAAAGSVIGDATSAIAGAAGAAATDAANALTQAAGALTGVFGGASPTGGANSTGAGNAGFQLSSSPVHFLAAFGLAAGLLL